MNCEGNFELVSAFMDGEMGEAERADAAEHIKNCPACRKILDDFTLMGDMIKGNEVSAPQGLLDAVMEQVIFRKSKKAAGKFRRYGYLAAACVLVVLAGVTHFTGGRDANLAADTAAAPENSEYMYSVAESTASGTDTKASYDSAPADDAFDGGVQAPSSPSALEGAALDGENEKLSGDRTTGAAEDSVYFSNQAFIAVQEGQVTKNALVRDLAAAEKAAMEGGDDYIMVDGEDGPALVVSAQVYNSFVYSTSNCISTDMADSGWVMIYEEN